MVTTILILEFLVFSFVGWIIDSGYRSFLDKKWINAGYFKGLVCPIYGFGGVILLYIFKNFGELPLAMQIILASVAMIMVEYAGGIFSERILKIKLWDYSSSRFHLGGHIDLLHSFFWILLSIIFYFFVYPPALVLESMIAVPEFIELPLLLFFVVGGIWLTFRKAPVLFLDIHGKMTDITVQKYKELYSMIRKMYKSPSFPARKKIQHMIRQQLKNTNASLKKMDFKWK